MVCGSDHLWPGAAAPRGWRPPPTTVGRNVTPGECRSLTNGPDFASSRGVDSSVKLLPHSLEGAGLGCIKSLGTYPGPSLFGSMGVLLLGFHPRSLTRLSLGSRWSLPGSSAGATIFDPSVGRQLLLSGPLVPRGPLKALCSIPICLQPSSSA